MECFREEKDFDWMFFSIKAIGQPLVIIFLVAICFGH